MSRLHPSSSFLVRLVVLAMILGPAFGLRAAVSYPSYNTSPADADLTGVERTAPELARSLTLGWNVGNTLEAIGGETAWGNPRITAELIAAVKAAGFDAIRLPCAWNQYADATSAEISQTWLNRVKEVVQMCVEADLYVVLNIHWDGGWLENNVTTAKQADVNAKQKAFWEQIATHLRDFDEHLLLASANEPNCDTAEQMGVLLSYHQTFVNAVRSTGGRNAHRVLIVQGPNTDIEKTDDLMDTLPTDTVPDRLMVEVHFYTPYNFTLMTADANWGKQFYYWGAGNRSTTDTAHNPTWGEEALITQLFARMKTKFVDQGIPVIIGEYSAMRRSDLTGEALTLHNTSRAYYHRFVTRQALANGLVPFFWDNGGLNNHASGIFNRTSRTVFDALTMEALVAGAQDYYRANPDGDWADNLLERFLGSDPEDAASIPPRPTVSLEPGQRAVLRIHRFDRQPATLEFEYTVDFANWIPLPINVRADTAQDLEVVSDDTFGGPAPLFFRWGVKK